MESESSSAAVAVYETHRQAEAAIKELEQLGFDLTKLSIVGKGFQTEEQVIGFFNTEDRVRVWSKRGAFWGSLGGLLVGSGLLLIPGLGPLVVFGPLASWIVHAAAGAALGGGVSAFGAVLYSLGIPEDSVLEYERAVKAEKYLLVLAGSPVEIDEAMGLLETSAELAAVHRLMEPPES